MTVKVSKPAINVREELADLKKPTGVAGEAMLRAETPQEQQALIGVGRRNMIINGSMGVCQRSSSVTGLGASETYFVQDRYKMSLNAASSGRLTATQETTDVPDGFGSAMKLACTTADTSIAAGEFLGINQHIEADICTRTHTGTSSAKEITLSFYAKANANATYVVQLLNNKHSGYIHNNRTFNVTTSWQRFTITFQADTTADSKFDGSLSAAGFSLTWILHAGSSYTSATLASTWATGATNRAAGADSFYASTNNTFFLTGVQLEVGKVATPFEHRSYGEELALCQRYYYAFQRAGGDPLGENCFLATAYSSNTMYAPITFPVQMRAVPSVISGGSWASRHGNNQPFTASFGTQRSGLNNVTIAQTINSSSGVNTGAAYWVEPDSGTNPNTAYLAFNAEL